MSELNVRLCSQYGLEVLDVFTLGHVCEGGVLKVSTRQGQQAVLKSGADARSIQEIRMNIEGYENMRSIGLAEFIPETYASAVSDTEAYILMEYCGEDVLTATQKSEDPGSIYLRLKKELVRVYKESLCRLPETHGGYLLRELFRRIHSTYNLHIVPVLGPSDEMASLLESLATILTSAEGHTFCFSNWDFTPDDVYLTDAGLKYSDPHSEVLGIPMVDLGCFAGVARDAYRLPGSEDGYRILMELAMDTAPLLGLTKAEGKRYFYLGRVLQSFLSARFRLQNQPEKGIALFNQGKEYLSKIIC